MMRTLLAGPAITGLAILELTRDAPIAVYFPR